MIHVCVTYKMRGCVAAPRVTIRSSLTKTKCTWAPTKRCCSGWCHSWAHLGYLRHIHVVWTWTVVTKANTLLKLKEVGSCSEDATRHVNLTCALSTSLVEELTSTHVLAFYTIKSHDCTCSDIISDIGYAI